MKSQSLSDIAGALAVGILAVGYSRLVQNQPVNGADLYPTQSEVDQPSDNLSSSDIDTQTSNFSPVEPTTSLADHGLTNRIRKAFKGDESLASFTYRVRIEIDKGRVTLKGKVKTEQERDKLGIKAAEIAGSGNVENLVTVK